MVFDHKCDKTGEICRYKVRFVAKAFPQTEGIDFHEVYSAVSKYVTVRFVVAMSMKFKLKRKLLDVQSTFINARLSEEIFVVQPEDFGQTGMQDYMYQVLKVLYGLRQSSRELNQHLHRFMVGFGCVQSVADPTLYVWVDRDRFFIFVVYVDYVFRCYNEESVAVEVEARFERKFEVRVDDPVEKFLGFDVEGSVDSVKLHNAPLILHLLKHLRMTDCKVTKTPWPASLDLASDSSDKLSDRTPYRQLVGMLRHLANTVRPDNAHAVG